jgi:hypothetical protein
MEVVLANAVANPIETHIHSAAAFLFDSVIGNATGASVVRLHRSGRLRMAHGDEDGAEHLGVFTVVEKGTKFGLSGGRHDVLHDNAVDVDGTVIRGWDGSVRVAGSGGCSTEEKVATDAGAGAMDR